MSILSVQSHVTYGHVGNSAAVFLLQSMGHEVWPVHTVHFSNHPGYENSRGSVVPAETLSELFSGLALNGWLDSCQAVLTGYMGSCENAQETLSRVIVIKKAQPDALILCDPVMGDFPEGIYVSQDLVDFYCHDAIPYSDVLTPNLFELEVLSGCDVNSVDAVCKAARTLIAKGPKVVLVTSVAGHRNSGNIGTMAVTADRAWLVEIPRLEHCVKGAGDAFAALWLGHKLRGLSVDEALSNAVSGIYELLAQCSSPNTTELPLVTGVRNATKPEYLYRAELV